jgi:hypothetical protein
LPESNLPALKQYHPATFLERGVALPFTTPRLAGTRARPTEMQRPELVILNPSGGRGVYIMPCSSITSFCQPTLHDTVLNDRISVLDNVTPAMIRTVGRQVAAEGFAGEEAMVAANKAAQSDQRSRIANVQRSNENQMTIDRGARARQMVSWISPRLGQPAAWTAAALEDLGHVMSNIGTGTIGATGRVPRLVILLRQLRNDIAEWIAPITDPKLMSYANLVIVVADLTLSLTDTTITNAHALMDDMVSLLRTWAADQDFIIRLAGRPEWLLDGWEQICLLWNYAYDDGSRRAVLAEIVGLVPILPKEVSAWSQSASLVEDVVGYRRSVSLNEDWRTGVIIFDTIARNERLRAVTC